jgi:hypothetical protein
VFDGGRRRIVLIGSTPELAEHPVSRPFVAAARDAILRAGYDVAEMPQTGALTAAEYGARVRRHDIFVSLLGYRYGARVKDRLSRSYAQLEFEVAAATGRSHFAILICGDEKLSAPISFFIDEKYGDRQQKFRAAVKTGGHEVYEADDPDQLDTLLSGLLRDPQPGRRTSRPAAVDTRAALGAGALGAAGFAALWLALHLPAGWAGGIAALAAAGSYAGALPWPLRRNPAPG